MLWLIALVVILLLFLVNIGKIKETLDRTNFKEIVRTQRNKEPEKPQPVPSAPKVEEPLPAPPSSLPSPERPAAPKSAARDEKDSAVKPDEAKPAASKPADAKSQPPATEKPTLRPAAPVAAAPRSRQATLYFVRIDDDGIIVRQEVKRAIPASDSPLTDSLVALLKGPSEDEIRRRLLSLVPAGTKLLGAQVRGSTVFINFSEEFMYNHYGIEGYAGQLKQVVYTATAFPTVHDVQILIEGERHDYLGGEGVYIGRPLSRNSF